MHRLIEKGLMFGNLVRVDSPALVTRYNRALKSLTGRETALGEFHIDISGHSPEVADELDDPLYLNPNGCNRQFILLTTRQKTAPLLEARFSTSRSILRRFIADNEAALFALTAHDAVAGELDNSVFTIDTPARLFDIRRITVRADTTRGHIANAARLAKRIDRFLNEPDAWHDDLLIAEMITLARDTGDITANPVTLEHTSYEQGNFWTSHFGGLYIFRDLDQPAAIAMQDRAALGRLPIADTFDRSQPNAIATFFELNDMVEPLIRARGIDGARILRDKMDFILVDAATRAGLDLGDMSPRALARAARQLDHMPEAWQGLAALVRWAESGGPWPRITSQHPAYFYTLRARPDHPDRDLINMLLAELAPMDFRQLFITHKQAFYAAYATWPEARRAYAAEFLARDYQADKAGARAALFGAPPPTPPTPGAPATPDLVDLVGPWGAIRRARAASRSRNRKPDRRGPWG